MPVNEVMMIASGTAALEKCGNDDREMGGTKIIDNLKSIYI